MTPSKAWIQLTHHYKTLQHASMRDLFVQDPQRAERFSVSAAGLSLDYSKHRITEETLQHLLALAESSNLPQHIQALLSGQIVNKTEARPALHTALRQDHPTAEIQQQFDKMRLLVTAIQEGKWLGYSGKRMTDVVNLGIGGSDLGPRLVTAALVPYHLNKVRCHFVANVDGTAIDRVLKQVNPETTLFIVASKSFSTPETLLNATTARTWLQRHTQEVHKHFIAITSKAEKAEAFGIDANHILTMLDGVGGRYSLWSTIGLPIALAIGMTHFQQLLAGAAGMDQHFAAAPFSHNMPVIMALLGVWYRDFFDCQSHAVLPYDEYLELLPAYLQQLDMESNGKCVQVDESPTKHGTAPVIWGGVGTNGQHAFHQLLHQGTVVVPVDFIIAKTPHHSLPEHHQALYANCLAQAQALMCGTTDEHLPAYKKIPGNKPSSLIVLEKLTPYSLGALIALYEHKVFVQGVLWNINSFDQWGVELGKQLSPPILSALQGKTGHFDASTAQAVAQFQQKPLWVILDRDGVINEDSDDYIKSPDEWHLIPGATAAIARLNKAGIKVAVATNQAGVARGLFTLEALEKIHQKMTAQLAEAGAHIDALVYCPHHPDMACDCRKPMPGLLLQLSRQLQLDVANAVMIGDTDKDLKAAAAVGAKAILVKTGKGLHTLSEHPEVTKHFQVCDDLAMAVSSVLT